MGLREKRKKPQKKPQKRKIENFFDQPLRAQITYRQLSNRTQNEQRNRRRNYPNRHLQ